MKRKSRVVWIAVLLALILACSSAAAKAATIGDLFGWLLGEEDDQRDEAPKNGNNSGKQDKIPKNGNNSGKQDKTPKNGNSSGKQDKTAESGSGGSSGSSGDYYMDLAVSEGEEYDTKDEVCAYLVQFHELPSNFMTKKEARKRGWEGGALNRVVKGKCIGGDFFGNYEGVLPEKRGREYHECDIGTIDASSRGAKRIVYSGDDDAGEWNIYYTDDHYETFTLLWGEDES